MTYILSVNSIREFPKKLSEIKLSKSAFSHLDDINHIDFTAAEVKLAKVKIDVATIFGYVIGSAALALYVPIIIDLLQKKHSGGIAKLTWVSSLLSFSLALIYPIKRKFALSTYVELLALEVQSFIVLALVCFYDNLIFEFLVGSGALMLIMISMLLNDISPSVLSIIQVTRLALDGYSLLPQIVENFRAKSFRYHQTTALMSVVGNGMRIFTTIKLVKDPLVLAGYIVGFLSNIILLAQYYIFKKIN